MACEHNDGENTRMRIAKWSATLDVLHAEGQISQSEARELEVRIPEQIHALTYLLANMGGHLTISLARYSVFPVPIPGIGGLLRLSWTASNRLYFTVRGNFAKAKFHSVPVMIITLIPFVGILSYLHEVKRLDPQLVYVAGEQFCRHHQKKSLREVMSRWPSWMQQKVGKMIGVPFAQERRK